MKSFLYQLLKFPSVLAIALLLCAACKQKEKAVVTSPVATPEAPLAASEPTNNEAATEEVVPPKPGTITPEEARNQVGKIATVRGKVYRVHASQKGDVFIDIGGRHPNAPFTAVCFKQAIPTAFLQELDGQVISVRGKIKEYQGKVEIILENANQISR